MLQPQNPYDFYSVYQPKHFLKLQCLFIARGKIRFLKDEATRFSLGDVTYDGFKQDVFLVKRGGKLLLVIGGERQGIQNEHFFEVTNQAECHLGKDLIYTQDSSSLKTIHVINLDCNAPNPQALAFLLDHLPQAVALRNNEFLPLAKGESCLKLQGEQGGLKYICLSTSEDLKLRKSKKYADQWRLAVVDSKPYNTVGKVIIPYANYKTFRYDKNGKVVTTTKPRLYKRLLIDTSRKKDEYYRYCDERVQEQIALEQRILLLLTYLKSTIMYQDGNQSQPSFGHFEALLPGVTLTYWIENRYFIIDETAKDGLSPITEAGIEKIIKEEGESSPKLKRIVVKQLINDLSVKQRIQLCLALVEALILVSTKGVVHFDIKPDNIMVEFVNGQFSARIIDISFSRMDTDTSPNRLYIGSPLYFSPESLKDKVPVCATDVFSMGIMMGECWNATFDHLPDVVTIVSALSKPYEFHNLFRGVEGMTEQQKGYLNRILKDMVALKPEDRPSLAELKQAFQALLADSKPAYFATLIAQVPQRFFGSPVGSNDEPKLNTTLSM